MRRITPWPWRRLIRRYGLWALGVSILAVRLVGGPAHGDVAPPVAVIHVAPTGDGVYGVDEPIRLTLPWPVSMHALAGAVAMPPGMTWRLVRASPRRFRVMPVGWWPTDRRVRIVVDAARLYPGRLVAPAASDQFTTDDERAVVVNLTTQVMQAYQNGHVVRTMPVSTGVAPESRTPTGHFYIWRRDDSGRMCVATPGAAESCAVPNLSYVQYLDHAIPIYGSGGTEQFAEPHSYGGIQLSSQDAGWLWHFTHLGTPAIICGTTPLHKLLVGYVPAAWRQVVHRDDRCSDPRSFMAWRAR